MRLQQINHRPGTAVAAVDHQLQGFQRGQIHIAKKVLDIAGLVGNIAPFSFSR